jgi:hypothetical protein
MSYALTSGPNDDEEVSDDTGEWHQTREMMEIFKQDDI